jgi:lincosamide nucleotidyltransferase A/C/D/E
LLATDVVDFYAALDSVGIPVWIDGGWAVDALLGEETRPHSDLDIALEEAHVSLLLNVLATRGYRLSERTKGASWNFVLEDEVGRRVDVHAFAWDAEGNGVLGPVELGYRYPTGSLAGVGQIDGVPVRCVAAEFMVRFKTAYDSRDVDRADVAALCAKFRVVSPL